MSPRHRIVAGFNVPSTLESYALKEVDPVLQKNNLPHGKILVDRSFDTREIIE